MPTVKPNNTRNFCIIAHIDAGKSTLADRLLEMTGTIDKRHMQAQVLDQMSLERERGITIKMQPVTMNYEGHVLNLIDTPGHTDFSYEVSRALKAVEGAILLIDGVKGVQAQTVTNYNQAKALGLAIIPAINKIDQRDADIERAERQTIELLKGEDNGDGSAGSTTAQREPIHIHKISAKDGTGVEALLRHVIKDVPPPKTAAVISAAVATIAKHTQKPPSPLQALIFDSIFDQYKGVIAYVRMMSGEVHADQRLITLGSNRSFHAKEIGIFSPAFRPTKSLDAGSIGYIATGLKSIEEVRVGDTIALHGTETTPIPGYEQPQPKVFASFYPAEEADFPQLFEALGKLKLNDAALDFVPENSGSLGRGFRIGCLGKLHLEITAERLKRESGIELIITSPSVAFRVMGRFDGEVHIRIVSSPSFFPPYGDIETIEEPWVKLFLTTPKRYLGPVMTLVQNYRAIFKQQNYLSEDTIELVLEIPLMEIMRDLYDRLKSVSQGYASAAYQIIEYREGDLVRLDYLIAHELMEAFSKIVPRERAELETREDVKRLKEVLPKQYFAVAIQGAVNGKIVARETIASMRKDVTAHLSGGDFSRKKKLLVKQREGKKRMEHEGRVHIPKEVFLKLLRSS
ncbi:MAG: elongation factor 4 [Parcubacteria group bacterium RIFCSPHIGHO2_01_FULL_47_10b]|nr:MAG: elongation factor 4 [Parcubacteria group bacterium RIFCSPHIGHO2_01_FULL_47_10b]